MSSSFGLDFKIVNDVRQYLNPKIFGGGPWIHHATITRGLDEYIVFRHKENNKLYMEKVERSRVNFDLVKIDDDKEWAALYHFCEAAGLLTINDQTKIIKSPDESNKK